MSVVNITVLSEGQKVDPKIELLSLDITKEVNRIPTALIRVLDGSAARRDFPASNTSFFEPGKKIEIKLGYLDESKNPTVFKGVVVRHSIEASRQDSMLLVELKDAAVKLTLSRNSVVYEKLTDSDVVGKILSGSGLKKGKLEATSPEHPQMIQYCSTDWDFLLTRAEILGLLVFVDDGTVSLQKIDLSGSPKHVFEYGMSEIYSIEMEADAGHQYLEVKSLGWDPKNQTTSTKTAKAFNLKQGNLQGNALADAIGFAASTITSPVALASEELQAWADATLARSRMSLIRGRVSIPGFADVKPLDIAELAGIGKRFNGKALVTGVRHRVDRQGWQTDVQLGLPPETFNKRTDIVDAPASGLIPGIIGLQIGVVAGFTEDPDKEFRAKVILPALKEKDITIWARIAYPDAGKNRGYFFQPEVGDEVVVGFFNNDPRQAVILGSLYGSKNAPKDFKLTKDNFEKGIVTKKGTMIRFTDKDKASVFIQTAGKNKILLDDDAETIQAIDQHGNEIKMNKDGIVIKSAKDFKIDASGNVQIAGQKVDIK